MLSIGVGAAMRSLLRGIDMAGELLFTPGVDLTRGWRGRRKKAWIRSSEIGSSVKVKGMRCEIYKSYTPKLSGQRVF